MTQAQIRKSVIDNLLKKVQEESYGKYLKSILMKQARNFKDVEVNFDFPVTAIIGPNGSGKSTVLGAAASAYDLVDLKDFFFLSIVGDNQNETWILDKTSIDKSISPKEQLQYRVTLNGQKRFTSKNLQRPVKVFGLNRTLPATSSPFFMRRYLAGQSPGTSREEHYVDISNVQTEASKILGKNFSNLKLVRVSFTKTKSKRSKKNPWQTDSQGEFLTDGNGNKIPNIQKRESKREQEIFVYESDSGQFSEFNFGTGEASILRMIYEIEKLPDNALILLEEVENGIHPLAVERLVEYFIDVASRKKCQIIFTTHSQRAITPLPKQAVWAAVNNQLSHGHLSIDSLKAISGNVDKKLVIYTEDEFACAWVKSMIRESKEGLFDLADVVLMAGDGNAVKIHKSNLQNPAIKFKSICVLDGDSAQMDSPADAIYRLPGKCPELEIYNHTHDKLDDILDSLTLSCQRSLSSRDLIKVAVKQVKLLNRDPHLLFAQLGNQIGNVNEEIVRGAFLSIWMSSNLQFVADFNATLLKKI